MQLYKRVFYFLQQWQTFGSDGRRQTNVNENIVDVDGDTNVISYDVNSYRPPPTKTPCVGKCWAEKGARVRCT